MVYKSLLTAFVFTTTVLCSCKKNSNQATATECFPHASTIRHITDMQGTIYESGGQFYISEKGTIDNRLHFCNLPKEFQINNIQVIVSGDVKSTPQHGPGPCCTDNFIITKISR